MKKVFSLFLTAIVLTTMLVGCSDNATSVPESTNTPKTEKSSTVVPQEKKENSSQTPQKSADKEKTVISEPTEEPKPSYQCYVISGAVIKNDDGHGKVDIQRKCDYCQTLGSNVSAIHISEGLEYKSSFTCANPNCSFKGKPQYSIIKAGRSNN